MVGLPQFAGWSQVSTAQTEHAELVCTFAVAGDHAGNVGRDLTELIEQSNISSSQQLHQLFSQLIEQAEQMDCRLAIVGGLFTPDTMTFGAIRGGVFLKRTDRTGLLLTAHDEIKLIEGKRQSGDIVVLATQQAADFINEVEQKFLRGFDTDSVVTSIIPGLHSLADSSLASLAFVSGGEYRQFSPENESQSMVSMALDGEPDQTEPTSKIGQPSRLDAESTVTGTETSEELNPILAAAAVTTPTIVAVQTQTDQAASFAKSRQTPVSGRIYGLLRTAKNGVVDLMKRIKIKAIATRFLSILQTIIKLIVRLGQKIVVLLMPGRFDRAVYVGSYSSRRVLRVAIPIMIVLLVLGGVGLYLRFQSGNQLAQAQVATTDLLKQLDQARNMVDEQPIESREQVAQVIGELEALQVQFEGQRWASGFLTEQLAAARSLYDEISGKQEFSELAVFFDLRLVDPEFVTKRVHLVENQALFLDQERKKIINLNLQTKQAQLFDLSEVPVVTDVALVSPESALVLGNGVRQLPLVADGTPTTIIEEGDSNRQTTLIEAFASYVYVLNPEKRNIYRYSRQESGFSEPIGWVSGSARFSYDQVTSWSIDGDIWIATREGKVHKLSSGTEQNFNIVGLSEPITGSIMLFTHDALANVYLLEADQQRLIVLNKQGEFLKQVKSTSLASTTALFVSEERQTAYATSGSIVYEINLE